MDIKVGSLVKNKNTQEIGLVTKLGDLVAIVNYWDIVDGRIQRQDQSGHELIASLEHFHDYDLTV